MAILTPAAQKHAIAALVAAYGLSIALWGFFGVFNLFGFVFVSAIAAVLGFLIGWLTKSRITVTIIATLIIRVGLYVIFRFT